MLAFVRSIEPFTEADVSMLAAEADATVRLRVRPILTAAKGIRMVTRVYYF
jgi:hypothetical protein